MKKTFLLIFFTTIVATSFGGCAFNVISVKQIPVELSSNSAGCNKSFILAKDINIVPSGGYDRKLKKSTKWICVGSIPEGCVYKTRDQILTIEGSNIYEADIVISPNNEIIGFYLPIEKTFSPLPKPVKLIKK
jgi:hypothetical protein